MPYEGLLGGTQYSPHYEIIVNLGLSSMLLLVQR
jgi:hypothetical protein